MKRVQIALTDDAADQRVTSGLHANHLAVLSTTLAPATDRDLGLQVRMLLLQSDELAEAAILDVELLVENEDTPGDVAHANEGVNDVRAHISRNVVDAIAAYIRTVNSPVAEVTDQSWSL